jgi:hypothetical protein
MMLTKHNESVVNIPVLQMCFTCRLHSEGYDVVVVLAHGYV